MKHVLLLKPVYEIDNLGTDIVMLCLCVRLKKLIQLILSNQYAYDSVNCKLF